jgi:gas vesicle protein GvpL/GvpF
MTATYGLYAYGLVGQSPGQLTSLGIDKEHHVYPIAGKQLCVIVSKIDIDVFQDQVKQVFASLTTDADQSGTAALLQAHEDVVDTLMERTDVVPFKFGTILKDEQAIAQMLQDNEEKFQKLLAKCTGRAEWGLKVYADQQAFRAYTMGVEPTFKAMEEQRATLSRGAAYLFGKKMEEAVKNTVATRLAHVSEAVFQALGKDANEAKLNATLPHSVTGKREEMILNAAYLIEREKAAHFCSQGAELQEYYAAMGLDLEVSGPWPPYSFT